MTKTLPYLKNASACVPPRHRPRLLRPVTIGSGGLQLWYAWTGQAPHNQVAVRAGMELQTVGNSENPSDTAVKCRVYDMVMVLINLRQLNEIELTLHERGPSATLCRCTAVVDVSLGAVGDPVRDPHRGFIKMLYCLSTILTWPGLSR